MTTATRHQPTVPARRRGLLLPGIAEIKTVREQLDVARKKGWIEPDEPVMLQRFQVDHFEEPAA